MNLYISVYGLRMPIYPSRQKSLKTHTLGVYFCLIGSQNTMPSCQKYTPPVCVFSDFAGWDGNNMS